MTSTQGHWIPGLLVIAIALLAIVHEAGFFQRRWMAYVLPVALILLGVQGIVDKFMHGSAAPKNYGAETAQHVIQGAILLGAGIVELFRARQQLLHKAWGLVLPAALVFVGIVFLRHAQHDSAAPMLVLLVQHRTFGATLLLAAAVRTVSVLGPQRATGFSVAFPTVLLLFGIQFTMYTEGEGADAMPDHGGSMPMKH